MIEILSSTSSPWLPVCKATFLVVTSAGDFTGLQLWFFLHLMVTYSCARTKVSFSPCSELFPGKEALILGGRGRGKVTVFLPLQFPH